MRGRKRETIERFGRKETTTMAERGVATAGVQEEDRRRYNCTQNHVDEYQKKKAAEAIGGRKRTGSKTPDLAASSNRVETYGRKSGSGTRNQMERKKTRSMPMGKET